MSLSCIFWIFVVNKWLLMTFADDCECTSDDRRDFARLLSSVTHYIKGVDASYDEQRLDQFAAVFGTLEQRNEIINPTIIIKPETEDEIQQIIKYARLCEYTISIKSGGHSYSGLSSCNSADGKCIQIHMEHFQDITFLKQDTNNPDLITSIVAGVGLNVNQLYDAVNEYNVSIIGGICDDVGVGGHYQSSAHGRWSGSLGMGLDYVKRIKIITSDGIIRNLYRNSDNKNEKDLFWAILGGSPGSWGIILEYEFYPIYNKDYPFAQQWVYQHFYIPENMEQFFRAFIGLIQNPYYINNRDLASYQIFLNPIILDPKTSTTIAGYIVNARAYWLGIDNGDVNNQIPDHPDGNTWFEELIKPFQDISNVFEQIGTLFSKREISMPISTDSAMFGVTDDRIACPPFRYYMSHAAFTKQQVNDLFSDTIATEQWIQSILNKVNEIASDITDNIEITFQMQSKLALGQINENLFISENPLENNVAYPMRETALEFDNWILFGDGDQYDSNVALQARQCRDELETIIAQSQLKSDLQLFAYTDLVNNDEYDLDSQFNQFYNYREDVYRKLKEIKTNVDCNNIFKGPLTIPPNECEVECDYESGNSVSASDSKSDSA